MHNSPATDVIGVDADRSEELLRRTLRQARRIHVRRMAFGVAAVVIVAGVAVGITAGPGPARRPSPIALKGGWRLLADVTGGPFSARDISFEGAYLVCPSSTNCYAIGDVDNSLALEVTSDGGSSWQASDPPGAVDTTTLNCATATTCAALATTSRGAALVETADGGASWTSEPFPSPASGLAQLSCTSATACVAIGSATDGAVESLVTADGGQSWTTSGLPIQPTSGHVFEVNQLLCESAGHCILMGSDRPTAASRGGSWDPFVLVTSDDGATWLPGSLPSTFVPGYDFSCDGNECIAVGNTPTGSSLVIATSNGGVVWSQTSDPGPTSPDSGTLNWDSCAASTCWVTGVTFGSGESPRGVIAETIDQGASWTRVALPGSVDAVGNIACASGGTCFALGGESTGSGEDSLVLLSNG